VSRTVLVAGGAGFIGSHVCKALAEAGDRPVVIDTLEKGHAWAVKWGPLERTDIGDATTIAEIFRRHRPRAVVHLAGYIEVGESVRKPELYFHNNATKSQTLIDAACDAGVEAFVFSSSCSVYGVPRTPLLDETHPFAPISPYAESKARVEGMLERAARERGLAALSMRYFNAAGGDEKAEIGEAHVPETHLLPLAVDAALGLTAPLTLMGTDYDTPDGSCVRDFIHVSDLAAAHVSAIAHLATRGSAGHAGLNLGSGSGYSVRQALVETGRVVGKPVPFSEAPRRPGDPPRLVGDSARARALLGWRPTRDLAKQIEDTLRWRLKMPR